jgi:hypothetical protein
VFIGSSSVEFSNDQPPPPQDFSGSSFNGPILLDVSNSSAFTGWKVVSEFALGFGDPEWPFITSLYMTPGALGVNFAGQPYLFQDVVFAAPEPSTWAMMLAGLAALGFATYRRARVHNNAPSVTSRLARTGVRIVPLLAAWILALTGPLPANASQKVALPNGEVLSFGSHGGLKPKHSSDIMQKEKGPASVAWHILAGTPPIIWDQGDKEVVANWMRSNSGQAVIKKWMTKGDTRGTVFNNADMILKNYFSSSSAQNQ